MEDGLFFSYLLSRTWFDGVVYTDGKMLPPTPLRLGSRCAQMGNFWKSLLCCRKVKPSCRFYKPAIKYMFKEGGNSRNGTPDSFHLRALWQETIHYRHPVSPSAIGLEIVDPEKLDQG